MSNQVNLRKHGPSDEIPWLHWAGWTTGRVFEWHTRIGRKGSYVEIGDSQRGARRYANDQQALDAMLEAIREKIAEGYDFRPADKAKPSKPSKSSKPPKPSPKPPAWFAKAPAEIKKLRAAIEAAGLAHRSADLEALAEPAIALTSKSVKRVEGVVTRFGGSPDLPANHRWPADRGAPLAFVAQYRLDELAAHDLRRRLPARGLLSVFVQLGDDPGERAKVYYFPDVRGLAPTALVQAAASKLAVAKPRVKVTMPPADHAVVTALRLTDDERRAYHDEVWLALAGGTDAGEGGGHQLLGWPDAMTAHATRTATLLAQIDSDDRAGLELGDVETLRLHVGTKQLAARQFGAVKCTLATD